MNVVGLFAGIGGIELGFHRALGEQVQTSLLCESWAPARAVLTERFPGVPQHDDVATMCDLPADTDVLAAGFPCTDLSQAGRTAGIRGAQSGLVEHVFAALRLAQRRGHRLPWLLIENVPNMLSLERGAGMRFLVDQLEILGFRWAYRVVDSRSMGVPQRRRRVLLVASAEEDPRGVLFSDDTIGLEQHALGEDAYGFYWTEGRGGLGWARDAVPTLKGGSTIGIPSPPAIWAPGGVPGARLVVPTVEDAEELQGFPRGWTATAGLTKRNGPRWKLVGNAVTVSVAAWVASRLAAPSAPSCEYTEWAGTGAWPTAAWGEAGKVFSAAVSEFPQRTTYRHLSDVVDFGAAQPLSARAVAGFLRRLRQGNLGRHPGFREDVAEHAALTAGWTGQELLAI